MDGISAGCIGRYDEINGDEIGSDGGKDDMERGRVFRITGSGGAGTDDDAIMSE